MSRVHTAMRRLEQRNVQETGPEAGLSNLVGALLEELADEVPEQACLETVRADLLAASGSYEAGDKKELAIRFYLAIRSLLRGKTASISSTDSYNTLIKPKCGTLADE